MRKIRIGKDISIAWTVLTNGEEESLEGRDLTLVLSDRFSRRSLDFEADGATLRFTVRGADQKTLGEYGLTLWENRGRNGQTVVDSLPAFALVANTADEGWNGDSRPNLNTETVELETASIDRLVPWPDTVRSGDVSFIRTLTEAEYEALETKDPETLYVIMKEDGDEA